MEKSTIACAPGGLPGAKWEPVPQEPLVGRANPEGVELGCCVRGKVVIGDDK